MAIEGAAISLSLLYFPCQKVRRQLGRIDLREHANHILTFFGGEESSWHHVGVPLNCTQLSS